MPWRLGPIRWIRTKIGAKPIALAPSRRPRECQRPLRVASAADTSATSVMVLCSAVMCG